MGKPWEQDWGGSSAEQPAAGPKPWEQDWGASGAAGKRREGGATAADYLQATGSGLAEGVAGIGGGIGTFIQAPIANLKAGALGAVDLADRGISWLINQVEPGAAVANAGNRDAARRASREAAAARDANASAPWNIPARIGRFMQEDSERAVREIRETDRVENPELIAQQEAMARAEGFVGNLAAIKDNPLAFTRNLVRSVPDMALGVGVASKLARAGVGLKGVSAAGTASEAASSAMQGRQGVYQTVIDMPAQTLAQSPRFREILAEAGGDEQRARAILANELADQVPIATGAGTALGTLIANRLFGGDATAKSIIGKDRITPREFGRRVWQDTAEEGIQGVPEDTVQHAAEVQADPSKRFDPGGSLAQNMAAGSAMGAGGHGAAYVRQAAGDLMAGRASAATDPAPAQASGPTPVPAQAPAAMQASDVPTAPSAVPAAAAPAPAPVVQPEQPTPAERALRQPVNLTALDRVNELDGELERIARRQQELAPGGEYGPAFDQERAELAQRSRELGVERESIASTWPRAERGAPTSFSTEAGVRLDGQYALLEADDLVTSHDEDLRANPLYPQELQPRDRSRTASEMQVQSIVGKLDPARLGVSADAATGAPIVGADGLVESGNARTIALKRVYQANGQKAADYRAWLAQSAPQFGLQPEAIEGMRRPVLVRVRSTPVNRAEFARQANASTVQRMSPSEQALSDAKRLTSLEGLEPDDDGGFESSRDFIRQFMGMLPLTEQGDMIEADGKLSTSGYRRIQNAVLAKAYGDSPSLRRMTESMDDQVRNVSKALMRVAPRIAAARERMDAGTLHQADIAPDLLAAVDGLASIKDRGTSVSSELGQMGIEGPRYSPEAAQLLTFISDNIRSPRRIADFMQAYYDALEAAGDPSQGSLLGDDMPAPTRGELLQQAKRGTESAINAEDAQRGVDREGAQAAAPGGRQPEDATRGGRGDQGDGPARAVAGTEGQGQQAAGEGASPEWVAFPEDSGTLGIPRARMPQIKGDARGALTTFLAARGISRDEAQDVPAASLKPTQAEFSPAKAARWKDRRGGDRSVLVSSDGHVLDGHHQWVAALQSGETVRAIRFNAPIRDLLDAVGEFPSATTGEGAADLDSIRAQATEDFKDALGDLARIMSRHTRAAMIPEDTPGLMPTLVKLFSAAIKIVGSDLKAATAWVKQELRADARLKTTWNKIAPETYRKAALEAIEGGGADDLLAGTGQRLMFGGERPPRDRPVVLVYGGSFNPIHKGHVAAARQARELMLAEGYEVETVLVSPSPQRLMDAKSGSDASRLVDRTAMAKKAFAGMDGFLVTDEPSREAEEIQGKLKRTQQADWARAKYPDATIISVTGEDSAPGNPPGFPSVYSGEPGTSHDGYFYLALGRGADSISSSKVRKAVTEGRDVPTDEAEPEVVRHFKATKSMAGEIALDGVLYDLDAPDFGMPPWPKPLPDGHSLLEETDKKSDASEVEHNGVVLTRGAMRARIVDDHFEGVSPAPAGRSPIAYVMGGGGASGKGTVKRKLQGRGQIPSSGVVELDPDDIKGMIPEYVALQKAGDSRGAAVVHEESSDLGKRVKARAIQGRYDIVLDVTLGDQAKGEKYLRELKDAGYEVRLFGVTIQPEVAVARAMVRARETGRYVPMGHLLAAHKGFNSAVESYSALADSAVVFDTTDGQKIVAEKKGGGLEKSAGYNEVEKRSLINERAKTLREINAGSDAGVGRPDREGGPRQSDRGRSGATQPDGGSGARGESPAGAGQNLGLFGDEGLTDADRQPGQGGAERDGPRPAPQAGAKRRAERVRADAGGGDLFAGGDADAGAARPGEVGSARADGVRRPDEDGGRAAPRDGAGRGAGVPAGRDIPVKTGRNYAFGPDDLTYEGSWAKKAEQNVAAVELVKRLEAEGRQATREEQATLAKFVGWGASEVANNLFGARLAPIEKASAALRKAQSVFGGDVTSIDRYHPAYWEIGQPLFGKGVKRHGDRIAASDVSAAAFGVSAADLRWLALRDRLRAALTEDELAEAARSTQYAHYTSKSVVRSMWRALDRMGFKGGSVLEPGAGIGVFPGLMPAEMAANSIYTGVEFDGITGKILGHLFPDERVLVESFVDSKLPKNFYDVAVGNPPFSGTKILADPEYAKRAFSLHDYFFAKSIDRVKPGGLVVYVTSRYTMDKLDDKARAYLADRADLVGAIRLPQTAFKQNAGTEVVTDVIFLRKKVPGEKFEGAQAWAKSVPLKVNGADFNVNEYFASHPEMVLGEHSDTGSMYGKREYTVTPRDGDIEAQFDAAVSALPEGIYRAPRGSAAEAAQVREIDFNPLAKKEGNYYVTPAGVLMQREGGVGMRVELRSQKDADLIKDFVPVRDALKAAHHDQLNDGDWQKSLAALRQAYDRFTGKHGKINQFTTRSVKRKGVDEDTGETFTDESLVRVFPLLEKLKDDPDYTLVAALETVNDDTGEIRPSAFLTDRVLGRAPDPTITSPTDAMLAVLNDIGEVDIERIASRSNMSVPETIEALGSAIYETPDSGWQTADQYLSGNVRRKLLLAREAAKSDRRFERNVAALEAVQPAPKSPSDIDISLGMNWIPADVYTGFIKEVAGVSARVEWNARTKQWIVEKLSGYGTAAATADWGTPDRDAADLLEHALTGRPVRITKRVGSGAQATTVFDAVATESANQKLDALRTRFGEWVWQDAKRTDRLVRMFNDRFNTTISRQYDGRHLSLPGTSKTFSVFDHVKRGAWRIIQSGNTYLAHAVGSGKTFQMVISAMEQKRLGLIKKPMMVVPNHMLKQFASEWQQLYPAARLMVADENAFHTDNRRRFVSRVALSDLDGVIITHSAFKLLDLDPEFKAKKIEEQLDFMRAALEEAKEAGDGGGGRKSPRIKQIEKQIEAMEQRLEAATSGAGKDRNVRFDELGVDMLYVDEAHEFRKLDFGTSRQVKGISPQGSARAFDLWMKARYLEEKNPGRSLVMASGTPVTNTLAELYTVQRFMDPEALEERGIEDFDSWAAMFGRERTVLEPNAAGKYEPVTRFTKFVNVPELTQMFREFADVLTSDHLAALLGDKRPKVEGGGRSIVVTPKTGAYAEYQRELAARVEASRAWKPSKDEPFNPDPMIRIIGDGRLAAIDMRFVSPTAPNDPDSKLNRLIDDVVREMKATEAAEYRDKSGAVEPTKGSAMMVFSDLGFGAAVAANRGFNARAWMEKRLRDAGIPMNQVAFMSDYKKSSDKLKLFKDVNAGRVRLLIGSSKNMGTGVNAQQRLAALFHLDSPWYPADLEQREGRIVRQGNKNPLVRIYAYAAKGSYDENMWKMLASKQFFIDQALSGDQSVRELEDLDGVGQYDMAAAMVAEDPRVLQVAGGKAEIEKMQRLYRAHEDQRARFREQHANAVAALEWAEARLPEAEKVAGQVEDLSGDRFRAKIMKDTFSERAKWAQTLIDRYKVLSAQGSVKPFTIGEISGFPIMFGGEQVAGQYRAKIVLGTPEPVVLLEDAGVSPAGLAMRAQNAVADVARAPARLRERIAEKRALIDGLSTRLDAPFPMAGMLADKIREVADLEAQIANDGKPRTWRVERVDTGLGFDVEATSESEAIVKAVSTNGGAAEDWAARPAARGEPNAGGDAPMFSRRRMAQNDAYETDLFGNPLPGAGGTAGDPRPARTGVRRDVQPAAGAGDTEAPAGDYFVRTVVGSESRRRLGTDRILTAADAAAATRYLYRSAVERFDGIVTDAKGQPLAVVGGFKGALAQAAVFPATIMGEAIRVPGAARIWFSHNHPSGKAELSRADENLGQTLANVFRGSGIEPMGILAVAGDEFAFAPANVLDNPERGDIPAARASVDVPVVERELSPRTGAKMESVSSPAAAKRMARGFYAQAKVPGLILLDAQHHPAAWVPLPKEAAGPLRGTGGLRALYRAISEANAGAAILVHGGEMDAAPSFPGRVSAVENIGAALGLVDVRLLDAIDATSGASFAERGMGLSAGPVYSRPERERDAERAATERAYGGRAGWQRDRGTGLPTERVTEIAEAMRSGWANAPDVVVVRDMRDPAIPQAVRDADAKQRSQGAKGDPEGFWYGGRAWLVASALRSDADVVRVLAHEALGHYGLRGTFGRRLAKVLDQIALARPTEVAAKIKEYGLKDTIAGRRQAAEEVLAVMAQRQPTLGFVRRAVAAVRTWLRTTFPRLNLRLSDAEIIRDFILPARAFVERGAGRRDDGASRASGDGSHNYVVFDDKDVEVVASFSRAAPAKPAATASERAEAIIRQKAGTAAPVDAAARMLTRVTGLERATGAIYRSAARLLDRYTPETIKAGLVSDYGVPEAVVDQRALLAGRQRVQLRKAGALVEKLSTLTREESRVAYEWMNAATPEESDALMERLPPESVKVLADVEKMIDSLSREAVALGQLSKEAFERNRFAYLRRSYAKHTAELTAGDAARRARVISILGDQYRGRGLTASIPMDKIRNAAPDWWGRKLKPGKADTQLKGEQFLRLERRDSSGQGTAPMEGIGDRSAGKLREILFWPVGEPIPAQYSEWDQAGTWEVRDVKGGDAVMWRDFTKAEREKMGEIDEARFAIAKTLHGMIHDVEVGRYLEWLARTESIPPARVGEIKGEIVEASERYIHTFAPGQWVKVPETKVSGTNVAKYGKLAGHYLPGPVWNDLRQVVGGQFRPLGDTYAKILGAYKTAKTALSPAVHMNNVMSNFVMADWHDVHAAHIAKALRIILGASKRDGTGLLGRVGNAAARAGTADRDAAAEILARYQDSGGDIGSWVTQEIARDQLEPLLESLQKEFGASGGASVQSQVGIMSALQLALRLRFPSAWDAFKPTRVGRAVAGEAKALIDLYQAEDDVFRLAAWLKAKEGGATDAEAGKLARRSFLDYHINAPWVEAMRQTAWPFISFTYRAVPMLLETAAKRPHKLMKLMLVAGALNALGMALAGGDDDERKLLPEEKAGGIWGMVPKLIRMPWNDAHGSPVFLDIRRFIPVGDVLDVGAGHAAIPVLPGLMPGGPLVVLGELVLNRSAFTGKPITLDTDTAAQKAAKVWDHLYKAFTPNLLGVPGTYATEGVVGSMTGRTDAFGREMSTAQAVASSFGVRLGSYPADVMRRNLQSKAAAQTMEIDRNIAQLKRQRQTGRISQDEFLEAARVEQEKKARVQRDLAERVR